MLTLPRHWQDQDEERHRTQVLLPEERISDKIMASVKVEIVVTTDSIRGVRRLRRCIEAADEIVEATPWSDQAKLIRRLLRRFAKQDLKISLRKVE